MNPSHESQIKRLRRIEGQVAGIRKMVEDGRYCVDIALQIKAARSALKQVGLRVLELHLRTCVSDAMCSKKEKRIDEKIREVVSLVESW